MMTYTSNNKGFMLIELIAVITILSILATIAVIAYKSFGNQRYDAEAISNLSSIYEQTSILVSDWGIGTDSDGITAGCIDIGPTGAGDGSADSFAHLTNNTVLHLTLTGVSHWAFRICIGYVQDSSSEGVLVSAHRLIDGEERVIIAGAGIPEPMVAYEGGAGVKGTFTPPIELSSEANSSSASMWTSAGDYFN